MANKGKLLNASLMVIICSIVLLPLTFGESLLKDIAILGDDAGREIVLAIEGSYYFKYFEQNDPDRLVIDLYNVKVQDSYKREFESVYLESIRAEQFQMEPQMIARIIFDLNVKIPCKIADKEGNLSILFSEVSGNPNIMKLNELKDPGEEVILETRKVSKPFQPTHFFEEGDYKIGSEDLLEIKVFDIPEFDHTVRVSENGAISLPLIGTVLTRDLTKRQLENKIAKLLSQYVHDPQVNIFIKEAQSKKISVSGAVKKPGIYEMLSRKRLLDMISEAGGFTDEVGKELYVYRNDDQGTRLRIPIEVERLLYYGEPELNIEIKPGDVVFVPLEVYYRVFVNGAVKSPGSFEIKRSEPITALQAITMAGGTTDRASEKRTQILRRLPEGKSKIININVKKIKKGEATDVPLQNGDIVYVPEAFF